MKLIRKGFVSFENITEVTNLALEEVQKLTKIAKASA